jgi:hypothetical protein
MTIVTAPARAQRGSQLASALGWAATEVGPAVAWACARAHGGYVAGLVTTFGGLATVGWLVAGVHLLARGRLASARVAVVGVTVLLWWMVVATIWSLRSGLGLYLPLIVLYGLIGIGILLPAQLLLAHSTSPAARALALAGTIWLLLPELLYAPQCDPHDRWLLLLLSLSVLVAGALCVARPARGRSR